MPEVKFICYKPQTIASNFQEDLNLFSPCKFPKFHSIKATILNFSIRNVFSSVTSLEVEWEKLVRHGQVPHRRKV